MEHTFLFQEGLWVVNGEYIDKDRRLFSLEGNARIIHGPEVWVNEGTMKLASREKTMELKNSYEIMPFEEGRDATTWRSYNPTIGISYGKLAVIDDTLLSTFASEDTQYTGCECIIKVDDFNYRSRGFLYRGKVKLASWAVELVRSDRMLH